MNSLPAYRQILPYLMIPEMDGKLLPFELRSNRFSINKNSIYYTFRESFSRRKNRRNRIDTIQLNPHQERTPGTSAEKLRLHKTMKIECIHTSFRLVQDDLLNSFEASQPQYLAKGHL